jgi:hypothetical protein
MLVLQLPFFEEYSLREPSALAVLTAALPVLPLQV